MGAGGDGSSSHQVKYHRSLAPGATLKVLFDQEGIQPLGQSHDAKANSEHSQSENADY